MIIRIRRFHFILVLAVLTAISFVFAMKAEKTQSAANENLTRQLPIVMYHHITEKESRKGAYVVLKDELEKDLDYIKKCGYTCVTVKDLVDFCSGKKALPQKIIMITFDDGFDSVYELAWPLLKERNMKAVVAAVGAITQTYEENKDTNVNYAYMTWERLREIDKSNQFEVQNHSYNMHSLSKRKGLSKMKGESDEQYEKALVYDLKKMQNELKEKSAIDALACVYPYGAYSKTTLSIVKSLGFKCTLTCEQRVNTISCADENSLFNLGRYNRPSGEDAKKFFSSMGISEQK